MVATSSRKSDSRVGRGLRGLLLNSALLASSALGLAAQRRSFITGIAAPGSDTKGWNGLPDVPGAVIKQLPVGGRNATLTHYETDPSSYNATNILRAVVMVSGIDRVAWNEYIFLNASLQRASQGGVVDPQTVLLSAPEFFIIDDAGAYPVDAATGDPTSSTLVWLDKAWGSGNDAIFPDRALMEGRPYGTRMDGLRPRRTTPSVADGPGVGSFEALDSLLATYLDRAAFPNLTRVVIAGFSLGGQLVQRYSMVRNSTQEDDRITYWISSPGSFLYLNDTRPDAIGKSCRSTYNDFKYGLNGSYPGYLRESTQPIDAQSLGQRVAGRTVRYLVGLLDTIAGDASCEANSQGSDHVQKMLNWALEVVPWLPGAPATGVLPANTTLNLIRNTPHLDAQVIQSDPAVLTLFLEDYPTAGKNATAPPSNGDSAGTPGEAASSAVLAALLPRSHTLLIVAVMTAAAAAIVS